MWGGIFLLGLASASSLIKHSMISKKIEIAPRVHLWRKRIIIFFFICIIPVIIYEKVTGHFSTWHIAIIINFWEWFAFSIGLFYADFLMNRGWLSNQYVIVEGV